MQPTNRASYLAVDPSTGAIAAWLKTCQNADSNPPCAAPLDPSGGGTFYYWESSNGSTTLQTTVTYGITAESNWNTNYVQNQKAPNTFNASPLKDGASNGFLVDGGGECAQAGQMRFAKTCGPNPGYNVVGVDGGIAYCTMNTDGHPLGLEGEAGQIWGAHLVCKGSICT